LRPMSHCIMGDEIAYYADSSNFIHRLPKLS